MSWADGAPPRAWINFRKQLRTFSKKYMFESIICSCQFKIKTFSLNIALDSCDTIHRIKRRASPFDDRRVFAFWIR